eukprot:jgi/Tetstr1/434727/TSEL_023780.t1
MAGGKKAADPTKATPAGSLAETPLEPTETTRYTTTLALLQALALKVDALSTRLDEHDNNKHKEQRDIPSDDDEVGEGGKEPEHDARTAAATGGARDAAAVFIDPRDWEDLLARAFDQGVSFNDATPAQLKFLTAELRRFTAAGAWEKSSCAWWVSRAFCVPMPGDNQWRFIIDLRVLNTFCARKRLRMETLMGVRHLTAKGDYMFSFDMQDGFYAMGIAPSDRDYFTVNIRETLYRLCGLPMGWSLSPYYFTTFTMTFVKHIRSAPTPAAPGNVPRSRRWLRRGRWRGARILPYVDDFLMFASSEPEALELRVADLLDNMGLLRNPAKGLWEPVQYGQHLGVDIDTATGYLYAPVDKLQRLARQAKQLLQRAARDARWLPVRELQSLVGRAQYLFLAFPAARFYLRELHDVVGPKWGGRVRITHQLRRDLQWWTAVPTQANGRPIHRHMETAYMHCDSSGYGWGAVLNGRVEARGFWGAADERQHITWKELKAVRLAVESLLPHLAGRRVMYEDNQAVCIVLAGLASRSPTMMAELRKPWYLLDSNGVHIRARYIQSAANVWADRLSRHLDSDDWQLDPIMFAELEAMWGAHSVDRFASALNAMLPRYNAAWLDPGCEAVDSLHLSDAEWRRENNYSPQRYGATRELRSVHSGRFGHQPAASEFCRKCGKSTTVDGLPVVREEALVSAVTEAMYDRMNGHGHHMELPTGYSVGPSDPKAWPFLTAFDDPKVYAMRELHALCEAHFMDPMDDSDALRDVMG